MSEPATEKLPPKRSRLRRWTRRALVAAAILLLLLGGFLLWVYLACFATPPELAGRPPVLDEKLVHGPDGRVLLGKCWFHEDPGCSRLYLEGDPFTIGYSNAKLTSAFLEAQERSLIETVREHLPSPLAFWSVCIFVLVNNRNLPSYVPLEYQYEILGLSRGSKDPYPQYGPRYHRILNYHAAHDISHLVFDKPVVGCTAFAAGPGQTLSGHLLVARNFDFEAGAHFDENKLIGLYRPEEGHAFISVSWPGMAGAITGLNEKRIYCSINAAHSEDRKNIGEPVSLVVRQVLQCAGDLDEAERIIRGARVFVSDSYLLADGKTGKAVVVEKSPGRTEVRGMQDGLILQANHFECPGFADDKSNRMYMREGTTVARRERLAELVEASRGRLDVKRAVEILRDRRGPGGKELAPGNRGTINPMIATHSAVVDLTEGILWVSRGPHQLGRFEAFSFENFDARAAPSVPEDPALSSGLYETLCTFRRKLKAAEKELSASGKLSASSLSDLRAAAALLPANPDGHDLLGRALEAAGEREEARREYREALDGSPPFLPERRRIEAALERLGTPPAH